MGTKWVVNEYGEKIWDGNDECKDVAWEDCTLEEAVFTHEVDVWDCHSSREPILYENPTEKISSASTQTRVCEPKAVPLCSQTIEEKCETIEWEECRDEIVPISPQSLSEHLSKSFTTDSTVLWHTRTRQYFSNFCNKI